MRRILPVILAAALCFCSCGKAFDVLYRACMFGTMQNSEVMLGDDGCTYHFTNLQDLEITLPSSGRIVAMFDVYRQVEGTGNQYEAELMNHWVPLSKEPVICETEEEDEALGDDPIAMGDGWWSGGHLNMAFTLLLKDVTTVKHSVNLQIVPGASADTLHTVLRHNAGEDKVSVENVDFFKEHSFYASFPLQDRLPEKDPVVLEVKWLWDNEWHTVYTKISR